EQDERAAHRRRARLLLVSLRPVGADLLADLLLAQPRDEPRADEKADRERREGREDDPRRDVAQHVDPVEADVRVERIEQVIQHQGLSDGGEDASRRASITRSRRSPRDAFTRITSPGPVTASARSAASRGSSVCSARPGPSVASAASWVWRDSGPTAIS